MAAARTILGDWLDISAGRVGQVVPVTLELGHDVIGVHNEARDAGGDDGESRVGAGANAQLETPMLRRILFVSLTKSIRPISSRGHPFSDPKLWSAVSTRIYTDQTLVGKLVTRSTNSTFFFLSTFFSRRTISILEQNLIQRTLLFYIAK